MWRRVRLEVKEAFKVATNKASKAPLELKNKSVRYCHSLTNLNLPIIKHTRLESRLLRHTASPHYNMEAAFYHTRLLQT